MQWEWFDRYKDITEKYLPEVGEGETKATQIVTAVCKLVYKWYNDGDVYDNRYHMEGWCNDLSSYANWLYNNSLGGELVSIENARCDDDYEWILAEVADQCLNPEYLERMSKEPTIGSVYDCEGCFEFVEFEDEEEDDWY